MSDDVTVGHVIPAEVAVVVATNKRPEVGVVRCEGVRGGCAGSAEGVVSLDIQPLGGGGGGHWLLVEEEEEERERYKAMVNSPS